MDIPRAEACGSLSEMLGFPPKFEKRTSIVTAVFWKCGALLTEAADALGVKTPWRSTPLAWLARTPGRCFPKTALKESTISEGVKFCSGGAGCAWPATDAARKIEGASN